MLNLRTVFFSLMTATAIMTGFSAAAQDMDAALQALDNALPGQLLHNPFELEWDAKGNDLRIKIVDADALTSGQAISARLKKKQPRPWDSNLSVQIPSAVAAGEEIQVYFYARTARPAAGRDTAKISIFVGRNEEPYDYILVEEILPDTEWKLMNVSAVASSDFPAGTIKVEYQLGLAAQTVEFGPVYVSTLGMRTTD